MGWFSELKDLYRTMGPLRFCMFFGGLTIILVVYATTGWWLSEQIGWPDRYGFHCQGRACIWIEMYHSGRLLETGRSEELFLFAWIWFIPVALAVPAMTILLKKWAEKRRKRIRSFD